MNKKFLKVASVFALAATLTACGKTEKMTEAEKHEWATENGYVKAEAQDTRAELEVTMGTEMSTIDAPYLKNYIGSVGASGETFGEKKDMLVFYGINECGTCEAIKPIVNAWVAATGNKVYYYNPDNSTALAAIKSEVLKKLGSTDGVTLTGPMLIAYVDGEYKGALSGTEITTEAINTFVGTYYRDDLGAKTVANSWEFENLAELRAKIAEDKKFILYATRFNCPWCRKLADTARDNALNKLLRSYEGNLATITSEKVMDEYNSIYVKGTIDTLEIVEATTADAMTAWEWLYAQDNGAKPDVVNETNVPAYWPNTKTAVQKAEVLLYLVATGEVAPHVTNGQITNADQVAFLKEVAAYAAKEVGTGEGQLKKKFVATDRNIPAFIAVGFTQAEEEANTVAKDAIISRRSSIVDVNFETGEITISGANANRALFPEYFTGATSGKTAVDYVTPAEELTAAYYYLTMWVNSWTYEA